jgi:hypothetical protein
MVQMLQEIHGDASREVVETKERGGKDCNWLDRDEIGGGGSMSQVIHRGDPGNVGRHNYHGRRDKCLACASMCQDHVCLFYKICDICVAVLVLDG